MTDCKHTYLEKQEQRLDWLAAVLELLITWHDLHIQSLFLPLETAVEKTVFGIYVVYNSKWTKKIC